MSYNNKVHSFNFHLSLLHLCLVYTLIAVPLSHSGSKSRYSIPKDGLLRDTIPNSDLTDFE